MHICFTLASVDSKGLRKQWFCSLRYAFLEFLKPVEVLKHDTLSAQHISSERSPVVL